MDKNAIKRFAVWARRELIEKVSQKALQYGVEDGKNLDPTIDTVNGKLLTEIEKKQRKELINKITSEGYEQVMEEVAYTWFNRFIALRFMEVNGYLPSHVRVFTNEIGEFKPQILSEAIHLDLEGIDLDKIYDLKNKNNDEELFKYLLIMQCNALSTILPRMFSQIEDYTGLLLPDYLLRDGSVIQQMVDTITEDDWADQVQILGWLYQYYNSEKKDDVFAALKNKIKVSKDNIPAATQLFTPDWIVRYMVENSLGRYWNEAHPDLHVSDNWRYYIDEAEQKDNVLDEINKIRLENSNLRPENIKIIDPCMGSGHILVYAFDVLMQIYESAGYTQRDAVKSIIENNIYGLDVDERAGQLAYFAIMMMARKYDRRILSQGLQPNVMAIINSDYVTNDLIEHLAKNDLELKNSLLSIKNEMQDVKEYGSLFNVKSYNILEIIKKVQQFVNDDNNNTIVDAIYKNEAKEYLIPLLIQIKIMSQKYEVVITNPPYMALSNTSPKLNKYIKDYYNDSKSDLCAAFIEKCSNMLEKRALLAMITQHAWMFLASYSELREKILTEMSIVNMAHLGTKAFDPGEVGTIVQTTSFVLRNQKSDDYNAVYYDLNSFSSSTEKEDIIVNKNAEYRHEISIRKIKKIQNHIVAYWLSDRMIDSFAENKIDYYGETKKGILSGNVDKFIRYWYEVSMDNTLFYASSADDMNSSGAKWFPVTSGGFRRRWYGNLEKVINMQHGGYDITHLKNNNYRLRDSEYYCLEACTWSQVAGEFFSVRYVPKGVLFGDGGPSLFSRQNLKYIMGLLNSCVATKYLEILAPSLNFGPDQVKEIPCIIGDEIKDEIVRLVDDNIRLARDDWDSFETSWEFERHPLICCSDNSGLIKNCYEEWSNKCDRRLEQTLENEKRINELFINLYELDGTSLKELSAEDMTIRTADVKRDIQSLISYAVGCMFGRYSLDKTGVVYAGGIWDNNKYDTFLPDPDAIIPVCDDEYFEDDVVARFIKFIECIYGKEHLEENLQFIADALGGKGSSREIIRNYFLKDFYSDHLKIYQKRPIYWLFDSGKKNGFKCLIYMHRYQPDTIARIRTDYVHEQQARYRTAIEEITNRIESTSGSDKVKLTKKLNTLKSQNDEIHVYEEKIHHLADQMISIDLDDGVKKNYELFKDVLAKIK